VLLLLVERRGQLVTKDDLMKALWPDTFVAESNLTQTVFILRKALGERRGDQRYVATVPGRGYRFVADVLQVPNGTGHPEAEVVSETASIAAPASRLAGWRRWLWLAAAVLLFIASASFLALRFIGLRHQPPEPRIVLAVLPFQNLTGDASQEYLSDGFTEEMISQLGRLDSRHLGVIARTSVMHYKDLREDLPRIGRELGVHYVLEGSVRRDVSRVRITAQLIRVSDQTHLWARQYDREFKDLLVLQGEIAQEIGDEVQSLLGPSRHIRAAAPAALSPKSDEAYDLYLKGRFFWNKRSPEGLQQAAEHFQRAIAKDPGYARAYAGLADSYALISSYRYAASNEFITKARAAALQALRLDDSLAEAHTSLALLSEVYGWDWQTAESEYRRAIQLDPNYATAHHWYAECLGFQGRFDEAFEEMERARQLDPLSLIIAADKGALLYFSRQYERAIEQFRVVSEMQPNFPRVHAVIFAYVEKGRFRDALDDIQAWRRFDPDTPWTWAAEAYVLGRSGQQAAAQQALAKLVHSKHHEQFHPRMFVAAYAATGDKEHALVWLEKAYAEHSSTLADLKVDPVYDPLRSDPRFQNLLRRVGLEN
jgi:TolB-like protein/Tfp pilus assembly protein PilF